MLLFKWFLLFSCIVYLVGCNCRSVIGCHTSSDPAIFSYTSPDPFVVPNWFISASFHRCCNQSSKAFLIFPINYLPLFLSSTEIISGKERSIAWQRIPATLCDFTSLKVVNEYMRRRETDFVSFIEEANDSSFPLYLHSFHYNTLN